MAILGSLAYRALDDLLVVVHRFSDVDDADWQVLVDATRRVCSTADKALVLPGGARLTRSQLSQIADVVRKGRMRVAVLLEAREARGTVAALGWLTRRYRAFGPNSAREALAYLNIAQERHESIFATLGELGRGMSRTAACPGLPETRRMKRCTS